MTPNDFRNMDANFLGSDFPLAPYRIYLYLYNYFEFDSENASEVQGNEHNTCPQLLRAKASLLGIMWLPSAFSRHDYLMWLGLTFSYGEVYDWP